MTIFAYMTHAHSLGSDISGYMLHKGDLKEFARGDPQKPQTFYETQHFLPLKEGDVITARCFFDGTRANKTTSIGMFREIKTFMFVVITIHKIPQDLGLAMQCASFLSCISSTR